MSEELENVLEEEVVEAPAPKKRGRKSSSAVKITGKVDNSLFTEALSGIEKDSMINFENVAELLISTMQQAYLEWSYPGLFKDKDNDDPAKELIKAEIKFNDSFTKFHIYDIKTITEEDDIVDDAYQISLEEAHEVSKKKNLKIGDVIEVPFDVTRLDKAYVRRVKQLFQAKLKEASRAAILSVYQDKIGKLIDGTVIKADPESGSYELSFGKAEGFLRKNGKSMLPNDRFVVGEKVTVYLTDVYEKTNPPSLTITRANEQFVLKLLERAVPEIQDGLVVVKAIAREAGKRTKIFVDSTSANIDPVGACIGPENSRMRTVLNELKGEKIDLVRYQSNKALQIVEAMKPATVIGLTCSEDFFDSNVHFEELERQRDYEYPKITVVVTNGNQGVAIGTSGVNVRLASRITMCTISVLQSDDAIRQGLKYMMVPEIMKAIGAMSPNDVTLPEESEAIDFDEEEIHDEAVVPSVPEAAVVEETPVEEVKVAPVQEEVKEEAVPEVAPVEEEKEVEVVEHVEIKNKPKISLEELEQALSTKKGPSNTHSRKRKKEEEKEEEEASAASKATAMPIYTEEEMEEFENEEEMEEYEDDIDYDQYDDDQYYDEK